MGPDPSPNLGARRHRILWVNHYAVAPGHPGGTRHFELGSALARLDWHVTVLSSDFHLHARRFTVREAVGDRRVHSSEFKGVSFRWLWASRYQSNDWRRLANMFSFAWGVARFRVEEPPPELVIGSSPDLFAALGAWYLARRLRLPYVLEIRDLWPESLEALGKSRHVSYHVMAAIARFLYRRSVRIIVLARGVGRVLVERGVPPERIVYVPNGVDEASFPEIVRPPRSTITCVYAGAHGPANGLEAVLDAAEALQGQPEIRMVLVGDGPSKAGLVAEAARRQLGNIEFRDPVAKRAIPDLLGEADIGLMVLLPTPLFEYGVSPNKLFDYLAAGLPVACNVPGDVADMVRRANAGEQARDGSGAALAEAISRLASRTPKERNAMGTAGRRWVMQEHGRGHLAALVADLVTECMGVCPPVPARHSRGS